MNQATVSHDRRLDKVVWILPWWGLKDSRDLFVASQALLFLRNGNKMPRWVLKFYLCMIAEIITAGIKGAVRKAPKSPSCRSLLPQGEQPLCYVIHSESSEWVQGENGRQLLSWEIAHHICCSELSFHAICDVSLPTWRKPLIRNHKITTSWDGFLEMYVVDEPLTIHQTSTPAKYILIKELLDLDTNLPCSTFIHH